MSCLHSSRSGLRSSEPPPVEPHLISEHLEDPQSHAQVLLAEFSSALSTNQPYFHIQKLNYVQVNHLIKRFYELLTNGTRQVKVNGSLSVAKHCSSGVPQGCVCSPILFTLYTNECKSTQPNHCVIKFSDDIILTNLSQGRWLPLGTVVTATTSC